MLPKNINMKIAHIKHNGCMMYRVDMFNETVRIDAYASVLTDALLKAVRAFEAKFTEYQEEILV